MEKEAYPRVYLYRRIVQAKLYIDEHYATAAELHNIADEACFSKYHFIRLFRMAYGLTPHQYLVHVRLQHARQLLHSHMPVSEVCYAVGFSSASSFATLFRKVAGVSPSAYQGLWRQKQAAIAAQPLAFVPHCFALANGWAE